MTEARDTRPDPPIGPEVDLRDYDFMPLFGARLFASDTWMECDDTERVAALRLWWASWHQEPAGSLPNNDRLLCSMAGKDNMVRAFLAVKAKAMLGWYECNDGRLYHDVVCEIALEVWEKKRKKEGSNAADRARKRKKRDALKLKSSGGNRPAVQRTPDGIPAEQQPTSTGNGVDVRGTSPELPLDSALKEKVKKEGESEEEVRTRQRANSQTADAALCQLAVDAWNALAEEKKLARVQMLTKARRTKLSLRLAECGGIDGWTAALEKIRSNPFLLGENDRGWKADFDFMLQPSRFTKLLEGGYDHVNGTRQGGAAEGLTGFSAALAEFTGRDSH